MEVAKRITRLVGCLMLSVMMVCTLIPGLSYMDTAYADVGDTPDHNKKLTDNKDGTYTISLDVTGEAEKQPNKANVIIVFDTSSSMNTSTGNTEYTYTPTTSTGGWNYQNNLYGLIDGQYRPLTRTNTGTWNNPQYHFWYDGEEYTGQRYTRQGANQSRLQAAEHAVNELAAALLAYNGADGNPEDTIEMALVDFANTAEIAQEPTTDYDTFAATVNSRNAGNNNRGTNWEAGLDTALDVDFQDEKAEPTYVIFVSDGNPTFRTSANGYTGDWNNTYGVYGSGQENDTNITRCYNAATDDAKAIVDAGYEFYTIGVYGNVDRMENLTEASGAPSSNYYSADNTAALQDALAEILSKIEMAGFGNVEVNDGTTNKVVTSSGTVELLEVDESSYKYYRSGGTYGESTEWKSTDDPAPPAAELVDGAVEWDLSSLGVLEDGVTYTVTFDCYPSQETYDTIAKLKNGDLVYSELDPEIKKYIVDNGGGNYSLLTNTSANLSWDDTRDEEGLQSESYDNPPPVATAADSLPITKKWEGANPDVEELTLSVLMDGNKEDVFHEAELNADNDWETSSFISVGIIKNGQALPGAEGHDFSFAELDDSQYHWEIDAPTVRPMRIGNDIVMLIKVDEDHQAPSGATKYTIDGAEYYADTASAGLTATNHRRSNLNLTKIVTGEDAPEDATFPFTLTVNNALAPTTEPTDDPEHGSDYWVWFSIDSDPSEAFSPVTDADVSGEGVVQSGNYWYAPSGSVITVKMKADWNLRFTNLPSGSKYTFVEGDLDEGFAFNKAELTEGEDSTFSGGQTTTGTIENTKTSYYVTYTNDYALTDLEITKVWDDANNQDGKRLKADELKAELTLSPAVQGKEPTVTDNGDGTYTITYTGLPRFNNGKEVEYTVAESAIDGYTTEGSPAKDHGTITNKHTPELTEATVKKVWEDANNQDGKRPTSLKVTLKNGEEIVKEVTLSADTNPAWTATVDKLPKFENGTEINYTWAEDEESLPDGYELTSTDPGTEDNDYTTTLTNEYKPETTSATVLKVWNDNNNQDGKRPTSLKVTLKNGEKTVKEVTLSADTDPAWTAIVENLPVYEEGQVGQKIEYTWSEENVPEDYELTGNSTEGTLTTITNKHTPEEIDIPVTKVWDDFSEKSRPSSITVQLLANGEQVREATIEPDEDGKWPKYTFTKLPKFADREEIVYTVTETQVQYYDEPEYSGDAEEGFEITNPYNPEPAAVTLEGTKNIEGYPEDADPVTFEFTISGEGPLPEKTTATTSGKGSFEFGPIEYDKPGKYTYTITETKGGDTNAGWTNDTTSYKVTVTVEDDGKGNLVATATVDGGDEIAFLNKYKAKPAEVTLGGTKTLEGRPTPMKAKEFSFVLKDEEGKQVGTATNDANGKYAFDALSFDKAGTYKYTIDEIDTGVPGVTYGMKTYNVVITVTDPGDGQLVAAIGGDLNAQGDNADYTNTYKATPTSITLEGDKTLVGRDLKEGEFEFTITGGKPLPAETSVKNNAKGEFSFGEIEYTEAGIYTYTVAETEGSDECITYTDKTYTVVVTVSDDSEGKLHATKEIKEGNSLSFVNKYKGKPGEATIVGEKIIKNYKALEGGEYEFTISGEYAPLPGTEEQPSEEQPAVDDTQNDNNTEAEEAAVEQAKEDAVEANEAVDEAKEALVKAQVADDEAEVKAAEEDLEKAEADAEEAAEDVKAAEEALEEAGGEAGDTVKAAADDEEEATDVEVPLPDPATVVNDENGVVNFGTLTFAEEGIYTYKITESGSLPGVTNDPDNEKTVVVTVKDNKEGKMVATVEPSGALQFTFTNTYTPPPTPSSITDQIPVTKEFVGHSLKDGDFTFVLTDEDGKVLAEATNKADGSVEFPAITFYEAGTYTYKVYEKEGSSDAITYDKTVYTATATVTDDYDGEDMEIEWTFEGGDAINFVNTWDGVVYIDPPVQKVVKGNPKKDETFTFKLEAQNPEDPMPEAAGGDSSMTMTITGSGAKEFGEIEFTEPGEYVYKVTEVAGSNPDYKYDGTVYHVKAVVTEDDDYNLHVKSVYYKDGTEVDTAVFKFVNTYEGGDEPGTGDRNNLLANMILLTLSGLGIAGASLFRRRKEEN